MLYCDGGQVTLEDLPLAVRGNHASDTPRSAPVGTMTSLETRVGMHERQIIEESLQRNSQHRAATARELGISRVTLYNKMKKFGMLN